MKLSNEEIGNFVVTEVQVEGMLGPKGEQGDKGEPFTYDDFTEQQLAPFNELKNQAQTAATTATNAANTATQASLTTQRLTDEVLNMKTDIQKVAENRVAITAVSLIKDQVVNVSEASEDVKAVSKDLANVDVVAGDIASVKTVSTNIKNVDTVSAADAQVKTVAGLETQVKLIGSNKKALEALYKTLNMSVAATTLPEGSTATVTQEATDTGFKVTFGIPKGDTGATEQAVSYGREQSLTAEQKATVAKNLKGNWLPLAGGEVSGKVILDQGVTLKKGFELDGSVKTFDFGYNWDDGTGPGFAMRGSSFTGSGDGPGCFVFWARKDKTAQIKLIGSPTGSLNWNGYNIESIFAQTKGASAPSAWKQHFTSGFVSQGGYVAIADVGDKITFPKSFTHTPSVFVSYIDPDNPAPSWIKSIDRTGFTPGTSSTTATGLVWCAIGFG